MSVTCCPLTSSEDGGPRFSSTSTPKARKEHQCCECRDVIPIGVTYEKVDGNWDGQFSTYRTCTSCVEIRDHFACSGWIFEHVWEDIENNFFPDMKAGGPCMAGLSPAAKTRLFDLRLKWLEGQR